MSSFECHVMKHFQGNLFLNRENQLSITGFAACIYLFCSYYFFFINISWTICGILNQAAGWLGSHSGENVFSEGYIVEVIISKQKVWKMSVGLSVVHRSTAENVIWRWCLGMLCWCWSQKCNIKFVNKVLVLGTLGTERWECEVTWVQSEVFL